jgi:hypothetical protein
MLLFISIEAIESHGQFFPFFLVLSCSSETLTILVTVTLNYQWPIGTCRCSLSPMLTYAEELGVILFKKTSWSSRNKATDELKRFDAKAREAINLILVQMLVLAHMEFRETMQNVL